jgi:hypothetical protein
MDHPCFFLICRDERTDPRDFFLSGILNVWRRARPTSQDLPQDAEGGTVEARATQEERRDLVGPPLGLNYEF